MKMPLAKLKQTGRSAPRAALAEAIRSKAEADEALESAMAALASLDRMTEGAEAEIIAVRRKINTDSDAKVKRAIYDGGTLEVLPPETLIATLSMLEQRLASCHAARPSCLSGASAARRQVSYAADALSDAIKAVEREAIPELLREAEAMQRDLICRRQVLSRLAFDCPAILHSQADAAVVSLREFLNDTGLPSLTCSFGGTGRYVEQIAFAEAPWEAARAVLARDPDAALPT